MRPKNAALNPKKLPEFICKDCGHDMKGHWLPENKIRLNWEFCGICEDFKACTKSNEWSF